VALIVQRLVAHHVSKEGIIRCPLINANLINLINREAIIEKVSNQNKVGHIAPSHPEGLNTFFIQVIAKSVERMSIAEAS
jgi:hypothetical protein